MQNVLLNFKNMKHLILQNIKKENHTILSTSLIMLLLSFTGCTNQGENKTKNTNSTYSDDISTINENPSTQESIEIPWPNVELEKDWQRIFVKNTCNFDIPPTMEVQAGDYRIFAVENANSKGYDAPQITIQQVGLNDKKASAFDKYTRVIINTNYGNAGDFEHLNFNVSEITNSDLYELNDQMKTQVEQEFIGTELKLIKWGYTKLEVINGMSCIHANYIRQFQDKPVVNVDLYAFPNYDKLHQLTISYRVTEADFWIKDLEKLLNSFRISRQN